VGALIRAAIPNWLMVAGEARDERRTFAQHVAAKGCAAQPLRSVRGRRLRFAHRADSTTSKAFGCRVRHGVDSLLHPFFEATPAADPGFPPSSARRAAAQRPSRR
jgi:hypothetical protein